MRLFAAVLCLPAAAAVLFVPAAAFAHGGDAPDATTYRTTVTGITPARSGLTVRTVEGGARLELTNRTGRDIEILGRAGEPYLEVRPDGTYQNMNGADPTAPPLWHRVSTRTTVRWHDDRLGPPPGPGHRRREWSVPLREQVRTFEVRGTLDWVPPPVAGRWWAGAALLALTVFALATRWSWSVRPVALLAGTALISYGVAQMLDGQPLPVVPALSAVVAMVAGLRREPFLLLLSGAVLAVFGGLTQAGVFRAAVVAAAGPPWPARTAVMLAIGAGLGMAAIGLFRLRATHLGPST